MLVTDENGCTNVSDTIEISVPNGLNDPHQSLVVKLYPNPTNGVVLIDAPLRLTVVVSDIGGKTVLTVPDARVVDLKDVADGTYFFLILDEHKQVLGREKVLKATR